MSFNFGSFWNQFGQMMKESQFDKHFEKNDSLQDMLDDDTIITEFRNQNQKLMSFLKQKEVKQLVEYVIVEPTEEDDKKRAFRYPFYASELLCCDINKVMQSFFPQKDESEDEAHEQENKKQRSNPRQPSIMIGSQTYEEHIEELKKQEEEFDTIQEEQKDATPQEEKIDLFDYLCSYVTNHQGDINLVLAGYFSKVFANLFQRKTEIILNRLYKAQDLVFIKGLTNLLASRSLAEILSKLLTFDKELTLDDDDHYFSERKQIITQLIQKFKNDGGDNFEIGANFQTIIQDICQKAYTMSKGKELIQELLSKQEFEDLVAMITDENPNISIYAANVVQQLLSLAYNDELKKSNDAYESDSLGLDASDAIAIVVNHYDQIATYTQKELKSTQNGRNILGQTKLKIVEIINLILKFANEDAKNKLAEINLFGILNPLVKQYPFNNLFHLQYHRLVTSIIEQDIKPLVENMFDQNNLFSFLFDLVDGVSPLNKPQKSKSRKGYLGFVTKVGKFLDDLRNSNNLESLNERIKDNSDWEKFKKLFFDRAQSDNEKDLGGLCNNRETEKNENEPEPVFDFSRTDIQKRYLGFLNQTESQTNSQEEHSQIDETPQEQSQTSHTTPSNNIFETFGAVSFEQNQTSSVQSSFEGFQWVSSSNSQQQSNDVSTNSWDAQFNQIVPQQHSIDSEVEIMSPQQFWKVESSQEFENEVMKEFEMSL